jgi:exopolysaccharide biosynthesis polyprenyl glycosylphosphotransferase
MLKQHFQMVDRTLRILDLVLIAAAFVFAMRSNALLVASLRGPTALEPPHYSAERLLFVVAALFAWVGVSRYLGFYRSHRAEPLSFTLRLQLKTQLVWMVATGFSLFALKHYEAFNRGLIVLFFGYSSLLLSGRLLMMIAFLRGLRRRGYNMRRVSIVGDAAQAQIFAKFIAQKREMGYEVAEISEIHAKVAAMAGANPELEDIFFILPPEFESMVLKMLKRGKRVHILPGMFDIRLFRQELDDFAGVPVLSIGGKGLNTLQAALKRLIDVAVAMLLLTLLSPLLGVVALAIKLTSSGPALFKQERLGQGARCFHMYKFRTMVANAEEILKEDPGLYKRYVENNFKLPGAEDVRTTGLGRFLRGASLDELPQLLNVLKGDMSLVGPRPITPAQLEQYGDFAELFLSVKPGLTGNWQINGRSEIRDFTRRATMDLEYIRDQSLGKDVTILLKTIPAVIGRKGAY